MNRIYHLYTLSYISGYYTYKIFKQDGNFVFSKKRTVYTPFYNDNEESTIFITNLDSLTNHLRVLFNAELRKYKINKLNR